MASFVGRSGADAVFKALNRICIVLKRYGPKLKIAIDLTVTAGLMTSGDAVIAKAFIDQSTAICDIFRIVSKNSGF